MYTCIYIQKVNKYIKTNACQKQKLQKAYYFTENVSVLKRFEIH